MLILSLFIHLAQRCVRSFSNPLALGNCVAVSGASFVSGLCLLPLGGVAPEGVVATVWVRHRLTHSSAWGMGPKKLTAIGRVLCREAGLHPASTPPWAIHAILGMGGLCCAAGPSHRSQETIQPPDIGGCTQLVQSHARVPETGFFDG